MERWRAEWESIAARIDGLQVTATFILDASRGEGLSQASLFGFALKPRLVDVLNALNVFETSYCDTLPPNAVSRLKQGLEQVQRARGDFTSWQSAISVTAVLTGLRVEVSAALLDPEATGRHRTERAFEHLSRSIVVDDDCRKRWLAAFRAGEMACERLGAVHLMLHGIWAFKSDAHGERTDLVLQEKLAITRTVEAFDALVLTEWKIARTAGEVAAKAAEAQHQAALYGRGSLAAMELATIRYLVLVTERREAMPSEAEEGGVVYRYINIAVRPDRPSADARRKKGKAVAAAKRPG